MNLQSKSHPSTYNLLSIGQRGVGKTVFLAGSYAELHQNREQDLASKWTFECYDQEDWHNLQKIFDYVLKTGDYPPPTLKMTDFHFTLQPLKQRGKQAGCEFYWWDVPGEQCEFSHPGFQELVLKSHSCCVFINAEKLVEEEDYYQDFLNLKKQVTAIASLVTSSSVSYAFSIILTQCDRFGTGAAARLQIQEKLQDLTTELDALNAKYHCFYSCIPIYSEDDQFALAPVGAADALIWIVRELQKAPKQSQVRTLNHLMETKAEPEPVSTLGRFSPKRFLLPKLAGVMSFVLIGSLGWLVWNYFMPEPQQAQAPDMEVQQYVEDLERNPDDFATLVALTNAYLERGQLDSALPLMEKIVQEKPESLDWQMNLAYVYTLQAELNKAEAIYDQILAKDGNYFQALLGKASLSGQQGEVDEAKQLFAKAEKAAQSSELKEKVRQMAKQSLESIQ